MERFPGLNLYLSDIKELLLDSCGHRFDNERERSLIEALARRIKYRGAGSIGEYRELLKSDPGEVLRLTELLTVKETYFFREPDHLNMVFDKLMPELMATNREGKVRIVSAGCASGEEPYSLAIMALEKLGLAALAQVSVVGLDIDTNAVEYAKKGLYPKTSFRGKSHLAYARHFESADEERMKVIGEARRLVSFGSINLLSDTYPAELRGADLIFYRNVSIYFPEELQKRIFKRLADCLREGGAIILGAAETLYHDIGVLTLIEEGGLFYYRKGAAPRKSESLQQEGASRGGTSIPITRRENEEEVVYVEVSDPIALGDARRAIDEAASLAAARQNAKALALLRATDNNGPHAVEARSLRAWLALGEGFVEEAMDSAEKLKSIDPMNRDAYLILGMIARQQGDCQGALDRLREVLYLDSACWLAHYHLGEIHYGRKDGRRARAAFEAVVKILGEGARAREKADRVHQFVNADQYAVISRHKLSLLKEST